ncbi:DUF300-domain-containing protein [Hysterangium stoloniferum]|nr:DUF300-domain-containing protein [Hysterangium stoloniferum]
MGATCPEENADLLDQTSFWDSSGMHWDQHRIGWAIAGGCAVITVLISLYSVATHARNYHNRYEQRQILRILYMPAIYAIISFFSFRFFRDYTYYSLVEVAYEAVTLSAFMLLLIEYVASTASGDRAENALVRKDKQPLPFPFCFWRFRPTKPYFMYTVKWSVMQYVIVSPSLAVAGIISEAFGVLCRQIYSVHFAQVYITAIDFTSISVALYGLILFYNLTKHELEGRRPLSKFLCIKGALLMLTFYQEFVFSTLEKYDIIKATEFWTATNVADGLNALATDVEMVFFAGFMLWSYRASEYADPAQGKTNVFYAILDRYAFPVHSPDFIKEIWGSVRFFIDYARGKPNTHSVKPLNDLDRPMPSRRPTFAGAFGLDDETQIRRIQSNDSSASVYQRVGGGGSGSGGHDHGYDPGSIAMYPVDHGLKVDELDYSAAARPMQHG